MTDYVYATTLPGDSAKRKEFPVYSGVLKYFPAAIARLARHSWMGNNKHNKGMEMHHARGKSSDHSDCIPRHLMDLADMQAARARGCKVIENYTAPDGEVHASYPIEEAILDELAALCWRAMALSQETHEAFGAPLAPGAKVY